LPMSVALTSSFLTLSLQRSAKSSGVQSICKRGRRQHTHTCINVCVYTHECINVCMCVSIYIYIHTCIWIYTCKYVYIYIYIYIYLRRN
jgi:hypothetical protein